MLYMTKLKYKETDMYEPIKRLLISQGFNVKGEVRGCDIAAVRDDTLWVVEMKLSFNITLLYQAMERKKLTEWVYIAIPRPRRTRDKHYRGMQRILKKLEIGLITVSIDSALPIAEIILFPDGKSLKDTQAGALVKREVAGRTTDTIGGSTKTKVNTAYRERNVRIACLLERHGALRGADLIKSHGCEKDANAILRTSFYGWFTRVSTGLYTLSPAGRDYLNQNADNALIIYYRMKACE
jgi:hypothetical protein